MYGIEKKFIARYEVGYRPRSRWEEKVFDNEVDLVKFKVEFQQRHPFSGFTTRTEVIDHSPQLNERAQERVDRTVARWASRWNGF